MSGSHRRPTAALACAAAVLGAAAPVMAQGLGIQPYPAYPAVRTPEAVGRWITTMTDVPLSSVVGIGSDSIFSIEPARQQVGSALRVSIRQEAIDPDFTRRLGGRSAVMTVTSIARAARSISAPWRSTTAPTARARCANWARARPGATCRAAPIWTRF